MGKEMTSNKYEILSHITRFDVAKQRAVRNLTFIFFCRIRLQFTPKSKGIFGRPGSPPAVYVMNFSVILFFGHCATNYYYQGETSVKEKESSCGRHHLWH